MSNTDKDNQFYAMADAYIALANKQGKEVDQGKVSAAFLYAAARFNVFLVAANSASADEFASKKEGVFDYFVTEYKKMMEEHFADYQANFDSYLGRKR